MKENTLFIHIEQDNLNHKSENLKYYLIFKKKIMKPILTFISFATTVTLGSIGVNYYNFTALVLGCFFVVLTTVLFFWMFNDEKNNDL